MNEEGLLEKFRPKLTEMTEVQAAEFFYATGGVLSVNGKRSGLDAFSLVLATSTEKIGPYVLNNPSAKELCRLLIAEGFGPE
jgi:hypothetical protein